MEEVMLKKNIINHNAMLYSCLRVAVPFTIDGAIFEVTKIANSGQQRKAELVSKQPSLLPSSNRRKKG